MKGGEFGEEDGRRGRKMNALIATVGGFILLAVIIVVVVVLVTKNNDEHDDEGPAFGGVYPPIFNFPPPTPPTTTNPNPNPNPPATTIPPPSPNPPATTIPPPNPNPNPPATPSPKTPALPPSGVTPTIQMACSGALYKDSCISSLSSIPGSATANLSTLASMALGLSVSASLKTQQFTKALGSSANDMKNKQVLGECSDLMDDTLQQLNQSMAKMSGLNSNTFDHDLSDVQTWVSAALTNPSTCEDDLQQSDADSNLVNMVKAKTTPTSQFISNALAVINKLAQSAPPSPIITRRLLSLHSS